ncbi:unnamed protein product [Xylocopa violacea]|uniref:C2H2-type domain-containing protein n=1 Tax=Xylocopa violacea TaxID=135666 RepID=A0ABP1N2N9_XYLVO
MHLWQYVDSSGKLHYSLVPASDDAKKSEEDAKSSAITVKVEKEEPETTDNSYGTLVHLCEVSIGFCTCKKCGVKFPTERMLKRHKVSHNLKSRLRRKRLNARHRLKLASQSRRRSQKPVEKRKYNCTSCDFGCNRKSTLTVHIKKKHKSIKEDSKLISCIICSQTSDSQSNLNKHMEVHRDKKTQNFRCNDCSFLCKRSCALVSHVAQNHHTPKRTCTTKKTCKVAKTTDEEPSKPEDPKETCPQDQNKTTSADSCATSECASESSMTTRAGKKQAKKPIEEQCNQCDFKCSKKSTLYSHKRQHKPEELEVYSCSECAFKARKKSSLYSHIQRKHKEPKYSTPDGQPPLFYCNQCDYKNKNKYELKVHMARKHSDDFKFSCETCSKKFKVKGDLTNHIRFSHKEQPVICDVCGKTCLNSNSLYVHQKFAHYKAKYECQVCKRRMVTQENLNEHMIRQHEKRESVVCEECGKTFSRNSRLKVHMRIHTGDKPYTCTICSKSFARRTALKQHLLIHTGIRPYVCDICGKAFTQKPGLISHRKSHPGSHPPLPRVLIDHILTDVMNN